MLCLDCCVGLSLAVVSGGYSLVVGLLIVVAPLAADHGIRAHKLHELQHVGSVAVAPGPWSTGSIVVVRGLSSKYSLKKKSYWCFYPACHRKTVPALLSSETISPKCS